MSTSLATTDTSPVSLIQQAMTAGADPQYLRELLAVRREWEADEARKAYSHAIADFQSRCPIIEKGDKAHNKQYAALDRIWRSIRGLLEENGLSVVWTVNALTEFGLHIEGEIRHRQGHSVALAYDLPMPDKVTGQNAAQQMGSATTYAKRYALCAALGIVTGDDDDGHAGGSAFITREQVQEINQLLDALPDRDSRIGPFLEWLGVETLEDIPSGKFAHAASQLKRAAKS